MLKYATDSLGAAAFALACAQAGVPMQRYVVRSDLRSGSTVGPMTAALTGGTTVDFGAPVLSMHSSRELCAGVEPARYAAALAAFLAPERAA
jgi:aspartyl aminopeptidase